MVSYLDRRIGQLEARNAEMKNTIKAMEKAVVLKEERDQLREDLQEAFAWAVYWHHVAFGTHEIGVTETATEEYQRFLHEHGYHPKTDRRER